MDLGIRMAGIMYIRIQITDTIIILGILWRIEVLYGIQERILEFI